MGPSGPDRSDARDHEILPRLLGPAPQRGPRGTALPVREPGGPGIEPPETGWLPGVEAGRAEGLPRRPRPEDRGRHPKGEEGLGRRPRGRHQVDQGEAGPRPHRDRFPRGSRGPREVQRSAARDVPPLRVAPRSGGHQLRRHGATGLVDRRARAPGSVGRGLPRGRRDPAPDPHGLRPGGTTPPSGREDARDEARDRVPGDGPRRRTLPGHARDEHLRGRHGARPREDTHPRLRPGGPPRGIPQGHVILIRGASGTMKSSLAYYVLYHNALEGTPGLYVTLEQPAGGLLEHVAALGLKATAVSDALPILDLSRGREHLEEMVTKVGAMTDDTAPRGEALIAVLKAKVLELRKKRKFQLLVIDSCDALELML